MRKDLNDIKKEFEKCIEKHEAQRDAWKNVKRVTKKDGGDFATLSKNFENAKIESTGYSLREEKRIKVYTRTKKGDYVDDYFTISPLVKNVDFEVAPERVIKQSMLCDYFHMNPDEIEKEIEKRVALHEEIIKDYESNIERLEKYYILIMARMSEIHEILKEITPKATAGANLSLRYAMEDIIKNYYFN